MKHLSRRQKLLAFILVNLYLVISTIIVTYITISFGTVAGQVDTGGTYGIFYLATFTVESNILLGIVALISFCLGLRAFLKKRALEKPLISLYLVAATSAMLTCLTVVFFLAPARAASGKNYFEMLMGPMFFFHFFNPVLSALTLIFLASPKRLKKSDRILALFPPVIYAIPYVLNVIVLKSWPDFYGLTFGGKDLLAIPALLVFCLVIYLIASILAFLHNKYNRLKNPA